MTTVREHLEDLVERTVGRKAREAYSRPIDPLELAPMRRKPHIRFSFDGKVWKCYTFVRGRPAFPGCLGRSYMLYYLGLTPSEALRGMFGATA